MVEIGANVPVCVAPELAIFFGVREVRGGGGWGLGGGGDGEGVGLTSATQALRRDPNRYSWVPGATFHDV